MPTAEPIPDHAAPSLRTASTQHHTHTHTHTSRSMNHVPPIPAPVFRVAPTRRCWLADGRPLSEVAIPAERAFVPWESHPKTGRSVGRRPPYLSTASFIQLVQVEQPCTEVRMTTLPMSLQSRSVQTGCARRTAPEVGRPGRHPRIATPPPDPVPDSVPVAGPDPGGGPPPS